MFKAAHKCPIQELWMENIWLSVFQINQNKPIVLCNISIRETTKPSAENGSTVKQKDPFIFFTVIIRNQS